MENWLLGSTEQYRFTQRNSEKAQQSEHRMTNNNQKKMEFVSRKKNPDQVFDDAPFK